MVSMPKEVMDLINDKEATKVLVTAAKSGRPHAIVAGTIAAPAPDCVIIGQILFKQSAENLRENGKAAFLVVKGGTSYEVNVRCKGCVSEGKELADYNEKLKALGFTASGLWKFEVCCVCDQSPNQNNGKRIA